MKAETIAWGAVFAAWRRHMRLHFRGWFTRIVAPITEPVVYLLGFGFGLGALLPTIEIEGQAVSYLQFVAPGMVGVAILFQPYIEAGYGSFIRFRFGKVWQSFLTAPLTFEDIFAAELIWAATKGVMGGYSTAIVAVLFGALTWWNLVELFPIIVVGSFMMSALGLAAASMCRQIDDMSVTLFLLVVPMFAFAGAYFPTTSLPEPYRELAAFLPLAPVINLMRNVVLGVDTAGALAVPLIFLWTVLFIVIAYRNFRKKLYP